MYFNGNKIKVSFDRAKYHTNGNEVYCTLQYRVIVPDVISAYMDTIIGFGTHTAVGKAKCNGDDVFNKKLGRDIANARAEAKAYKHAQVLVNKYVKELAKTYYNMTLEFDERVDFIQRHDAEYVAEISK